MLRHGATTYCEIAIKEGRKRQVRRMFSAIGHPVIELARISFGPIDIDDIGKASWRYLTPAEVAALKAAVGIEEGSS